jgi:hypothetical protein
VLEFNQNIFTKINFERNIFYFKTIIRLRTKHNPLKGEMWSQNKIRTKHNPLKGEMWSQNKMIDNKIDNKTLLNSFFISPPCLVVAHWWWPFDDMIVDIFLHKICSSLTNQLLGLIFEALAILHIFSGLFCLKNHALG